MLEDKIRLKTMEVPEDTRSIAYYIMLYLGVGNLFPWNAFITASTYYAMRFCGTSIEDSFENYFSLTYTLSQTLGLGLAILYQDRLTLNQKISKPLLLYSGIFGVTTILVLITSMDPFVLFGLTLLSAFLSGLVGAVLSGGLFGLGAMLPAAYTGAIMTGQGVAGVVVSASAVLTLYAGGNTTSCTDDESSEDETCEQSVSFSALAYFLIATLVLLTCVVAFSSLMRMKFTRYYVTRATGELSQTENPLLGHVPEEENDNAELVPKEEPSSAVEVFRQIWIPAMSVWGTFAVTIGVFPALTVFIESTQACQDPSQRFYNDLFVPFLFLLCNIFDLVGRVVAENVRPLFNAKNVWIGSASRLLFFPLFMLCNLSNSKLPVVFNSDVFPILFMILMAFSNGYVASNCMMMGASSVAAKDSSLAGTIMIFSLTVGLLTGSCISFLTVLITQGSL